MAKPLQRRIAILEGVDTTLLTANNFESVCFPNAVSDWPLHSTGLSQSLTFLF
ncbi:MAG: hypothetical protein AAFV85_21565 [Cyanobacteria bacterium J06634_6]